MSRQETTHVQTELTGNEYEAFRTLAQEEGLTLKEACHQAVTDWIARQRSADPHDPAFTVLDELESAELPESAATDASEESDLVDEWEGSSEDWRLAEDLPNRS